MSRESMAARQAPAPELAETRGHVLQRKCACGQHTTAGGECDACRRRREQMERGGSFVHTLATGRVASGHAGASRFARDFSRVRGRAAIQPKLRVGSPNDRFEREADRVADSVTRMTATTVVAVGGAPGELGASGGSTRGAPAVMAAGRTSPPNVGSIAGTAGEADLQAGTSCGSTRAALPGLGDSGRPLDASTRAFFEQRMGHDFGSVRIHTGASADRLAASLNARAFTYGNHIVFASGELGTSGASGRHLLAHELAHTIQQGAAPAIPAVATTVASTAGSGGPATPIARRAAAPDVQRACTDLASPPPMVCDIATTSPGSTGTSIDFGVNSSGLTPAAVSTLQAIAAAWHTAGGSDILRIDGFASVEGQELHNCPLSCDRAMAVAAELNAPSNGDPGVPSTHIEIFAQGETSIFSASTLAPNRRVVITTTGGAPAPGPVCGLTITGADEVDHYCAAYVPSDAAACGTFPAPAITLTATGAAAGSTPRWSVVRNPANASIVGATAGASVDIQGDVASTAQGDVTVQVTDGTCTTQHQITVREPSEMTAAGVPSSGADFVENIITYTVRDQFGNPMGAGICVDETITVCADSHGVPFAFGDAATNAAGQVQDTLRLRFPGGIPAALCIKLDQSLTAGGCGPLLNNTIVFQAGGVTLNHNDSCAAGDACP